MLKNRTCGNSDGRVKTRKGEAEKKKKKKSNAAGRRLDVSDTGISDHRRPGLYSAEPGLVLSSTLEESGGKKKLSTPEMFTARER